MDKSRTKIELKTTATQSFNRKKSAGVYTSETDNSYTGGVNQSSSLYRTPTNSNEEIIGDKIIITKRPNVTT